MKRRIESYARWTSEVDTAAIQVQEESPDLLWFAQQIPSRGHLIDITETITCVWIATYWEAPQKRGIQMLVSWSAYALEETGEALDIETWWPLVKVMQK